MHRKVILVDMDGVLADFENGFITQYKNLFPSQVPITVDQRKEFYVINDYPVAVRDTIEQVYHTPGFFKNLSPIPGAKEALETMRALHHEVFICTSPLNRYDDCVLEKYDWVEKNLGHGWTKRMIVTSDKTLVHGDYLIDDKPNPVGVKIPGWEHILYDAPYNRLVTHKRRITWDIWKTVLTEISIPVSVNALAYGEN